MNNTTKTTVSTSFPFLSILALIFITLKLIGIITWSWWLVLLPIYGPLALVLVGLAIYLIICVVAEVAKGRK